MRVLWKLPRQLDAIRAQQESQHSRGTWQLPAESGLARGCENESSLNASDQDAALFLRERLCAQFACLVNQLLHCVPCAQRYHAMQHAM